MDQELELQLKRVLTAIEKLLPKPVPQVDWESVKAAVWRRHAMSGHLEGVEGAIVELDDLIGIDRQKEVVVENTRQFLAGYPASNILLWGTRGTGKSSLVKAILNSYSFQGLRLVQVDKGDLINLPD